MDSRPVTKYIKAIQETSSDALKTKISASMKNYFVDKYILEFANKGEPYPRLLPILNRGTWTRVYSIRHVIDSVFTNMLTNTTNPEEQRVQIINLGAGLETLYFNLKDKYEGKVDFVCIDLDYDQIVKRKIEVIDKSDLLKNRLSKDFVIDSSMTSLSSSDYFILSCDIMKTDDLLEKLSNTKVINFDTPTILIAECLLVYITKSNTVKILSTFTKNFKNLVFTMYDLINPYDPFGQEMIDNLKTRNIKLYGLEETDSIEKQVQRMKDVGFVEVEAFDMVEYAKHVDPDELKRVNKLELFDEFEEFNMLQAHSCYGLGLILEDKYKFLSSVKLTK